MANSSEWVGAFADTAFFRDVGPAPGWLALMDTAADFREALPFGEPEPEPAPEPSVPVPDPLADAVKAAFARGEAAGRAAATAEAAEQAARQRALRLAFRAFDEAARAVLAEDLAATVTTLTEGVLGNAAIDRGGLLARCEAAARRIGGAAENLALHLHPEDVAMIGPEALAGWRVVADPALTRGALRIEGPDGAVSEGPEEWRRAIEAAVQG